MTREMYIKYEWRCLKYFHRSISNKKEFYNNFSNRHINKLQFNHQLHTNDGQLFELVFNFRNGLTNYQSTVI